METTYFKDADTLLVNFNNNEITDTKDLNENVLIEMDKHGNVVSMTIEHAQKQAEISNFSFNQVEKSDAINADNPRHDVIGEFAATQCFGGAADDG